MKCPNVGGGDQNKIPSNAKLTKHKLFRVFFSSVLDVEGGGWESILGDSLEDALNKAKILHKHSKIYNVKEEGDCYI